MINKIFLLVAPLIITAISAIGQSVQKGPYTVSVITKGIYHIEDANDSNPAGVKIGDDGQMVSMNNCSDMYLIVGKEKALLIDLSNAIKWDKTATKSLRSLVSERAGTSKLFVTVTHNHGDHLGMLPAFVDDKNAQFWIPKAEFEGRNIFPEKRTTYFAENESLDLSGGMIVNTIEVPGHTKHSTLFFVRGKNLVFTGDAIGSGSGVWLFNYESFPTYKKGIDHLIDYMENPENNIDTDKLVIYGGHYWQGQQLGKLTSQYIYDMRTLIDQIGKGTADVEDYTASFPFLNANFKYRTATITWNKDAALKYAQSLKQ